MGQYVRRDASVSKGRLQAAAKAACAELHDVDGLGGEAEDDVALNEMT